jgi:hypothetical protein
MEWPDVKSGENENQSIVVFGIRALDVEIALLRTVHEVLLP